MPLITLTHEDTAALIKTLADLREMCEDGACEEGDDLSEFARRIKEHQAIIFGLED